MDLDKLTRFKDASWLGAEESCIIGGAGGIGSWLAFLLARANFIPIVYDFDRLEEHNLGGQLFHKDQIGKLKVEALGEVIKDFCDTNIWQMNEEFNLRSMGGNIMFSGFDNMKAREDMFAVWCKYVEADYCEKKDCIFIDGRLLAEQMQILCITGDSPENIERYKTEYLFSDEDVPDGPCTMKQTSHAAAMIAAMMVGFFTNFVHNMRTNTKSRIVPFYHEYFIPLNMFS